MWAHSTTHTLPTIVGMGDKECCLLFEPGGHLMKKIHHFFVVAVLLVALGGFIFQRLGEGVLPHVASGLRTGASSVAGTMTGSENVGQLAGVCPGGGPDDC